MAEQMTIRDFVDRSASKYGDCVAFQMKRGGEYKKWTFAEVAASIKNLQSALSSLGVSTGDRVAILSENRPEWAISYLAVGGMGAVTVPLDSLISYPDHINLINDSGSKGLIVSEKYLKDLRARKGEMPELKFMISMDLVSESGGIFSFWGLSSLPALPGRQAGGRQGKGPNKMVDAKVEPDDLLSILYTSGTTGVSKGVMLTHRNITSNILAVAKIFHMIGPDDNFLSVLPIHHTFETTAGLMAPFYMGCRITYAESLKSYSIIANMQETKVTIMCGVPLLHKIFFEGIIREAEAKGAMVKLLFKLLFAVSKTVKLLTGRNIGRKLFGMVHKKLGGNVRFWVSGGAAIDPDVIRGFDAMGLTILQGYGLTESSPIITCCSLEANKIGSVGRAIEDVQIKIDKPDGNGIGEVLAKGPNIMKGYYKKPEATAETVKDGWLYTGDLGYLDGDGFLYITGRLKDVIISGSGINVYPEEIERELERIPLIAESCVLGRKIKEGMRKGMEEVFAVVIPSREYFEKHAETKGAKVDDDLINKLIKVEIAKLNEGMPEHRRIAAYLIRKEEFPKTSTKKIKRFVLRKELGLI